MKAVFIGSNPKVAQTVTLSMHLRWPDTELQTAGTAADGLNLIKKIFPDVVLLHPDFNDISLPQAIKDLRLFSVVPLLVLGSGNDELEVITALDSGADDYVRLPCELTEVMSRVWALLRRMKLIEPHPQEGPLQSGPLVINPSTYEASFHKQPMKLTSTEFRLLYLLARNRGTVVQHQTLEQHIWGETQTETGTLVKKYVQRLRRKLGDDSRHPRWIASVHGVGYRFIGPAPSQAAEQMAG